MELVALRSLLLVAFASACVLAANAQQPMAASQRPAITGVAFARFYATDAAAAKHFYADTLGYQGQPAGAATRYPVNALQWIEVQPLSQPAPASRMAAIGFTTRDVAALSRYLASKGFIPEQSLANDSFSVRDPEGNLVYFVQSGSKQFLSSTTQLPHATSARIIHVGFAVESASAEDRFYRETLGFHPYWHGGMTSDRTDWSSLQVPEGTDWLEYMLTTPKTGDLHQLGGADHVSLGTANMQEVVAQLKANKCEGANCTKTQMGKDGKMQLNLFDPDFTRVEFMEFTPRQTPCCSPIVGKAPGPGQPLLTVTGRAESEQRR